MPRPVPTAVTHFTHLRNLPGIIAGGLLCDTICRQRQSTQVEIGSEGVKERRRNREVPIDPGGVVAGYVPFYFAPRSPMMYTLEQSNYEYHEGFDEVIYLVSSLERLTEIGTQWVVSDRNAALELATFRTADGDLGHVDWELMKRRYWGKTDEDPERPDRRMAECLVLREVPWVGFQLIATKSERVAHAVRTVMERLNCARPEVTVRSGWYF